MGMDAIEISLALVFLSFCLYMVYGRRERQRESALLHMLKRIVDRRLTHNLLEDELREVVIGRDEIEQDSFDELIKTAVVLDLAGPCTYLELLETAAGGIADETGMAKNELIDRFLKRQTECNTAISPFLAIPHIILEGEGRLFMRIIRCREGVRFTDAEDSVKAVFLFGGTAENRLLHLKTLASIATLVGLEGFEGLWEAAEGETELKDLMLLNDRRRYS
jgi:mannitol/fructose-specific phosphotransferase system IIA component (Ntr-type)